MRTWQLDDCDQSESLPTPCLRPVGPRDASRRARADDAAFFNSSFGGAAGGSAAPERTQERVDGPFDGSTNFALAGLGFETEQLAQVNFAAHQADELLSGEPHIRQRQSAGSVCAAQKPFDLGQVAL